MLLADHPEESPVWVGVREDHVSLERASVGEVDAARRAVTHLYLSDLGLRKDFGSVCLCGMSDGPCDRAHAAADEAPRALMTFQGTDDVVVLHVGGARVAGSCVRPDHPPHAEGRLDLLGFDVLVQKPGDASTGQRFPVLLALRTVEGAFYLFDGGAGPC